MSQNLISSLNLVHRVVEAAVAYTIARMQVLERIAGNPVGISYQIHGPVAALMARNLPSVNFNSVHGLRKGRRNKSGLSLNGIGGTACKRDSRLPRATMIMS
jgi:hypothetical protein